jgi:hypothetical protein
MPPSTLIAPCGDVCSECPRYKATLEQDVEQLQYLAALWFKVGFRDRIVPADEMKCEGCHPGKTCSFQINNCTHREGRKTCGECDFYPCDKISAVFKQSKENSSVCLKRCNKEEFAMLSNAFFRKNEILTSISKSAVNDL